MDRFRLAVVASLALTAISCSDAGGEPTPAHPDTANAASDSDALNAVGDIAAVDDHGPTVFHQLRLARSESSNHNDSVSSDPIVLPGALARAEFGFFDDDAILQQLPPQRLIAMAQSDSGFRFVADLDRDGDPEHYRIGWYRLPGQEPGQFLAVFEDFALRDIFLGESYEALRISWGQGAPVVYACNCPDRAQIVYARGKLRMRWRNDGGRFGAITRQRAAAS